MTHRGFPVLVSLALLCGAAGCQGLYYGTLEKFGVEKRDVMTKRVKAAQTSQQEAKTQFKSALEEFSSVVNVKGGDLEKEYQRLKAVLERCEGRAGDVHDRIAAVEGVSEALFKEWNNETRQYSSPELRRKSEQKLRDTRRRYDELIGAMNRAEGTMEPVLKVLRDQVLFLKHNLNAQAIASLKDELGSVQTNVDALVKEMETAIREADVFLKTMGE